MMRAVGLDPANNIITPAALAAHERDIGEVERAESGDAFENNAIGFQSNKLNNNNRESATSRSIGKKICDVKVMTGNPDKRIRIEND